MARVFTQAIFIGSHTLTHELEALFGQFGTDLFDLGRVAGLQRQLEEAAGNGHVGVGTVVQHRHHIAAPSGIRYIATRKHP